MRIIEPNDHLSRGTDGMAVTVTMVASVGGAIPTVMALRVVGEDGEVAGMEFLVDLCAPSALPVCYR